jgi:polyisoprenoid-binding protein YceI
VQVVAGLLAVGVVLAGVWALVAGPSAAALRGSVRSRRAWLVVGPVTVLVLALFVPYAYVEWGQDEAPAPLAFAPIDDDTTTTRPTTARPAPDDGLPTGSTVPFVPPEGGTPLPTAGATTTAPAAAPNEVEGTWRVGRGSVAGYRAQEVLLVQDNTAVGRTDKVSGEMTIAGTTVTAAEYVVDMSAVTSDQPQRDQRYREIMDTPRHPTSRFVLTQPIDVDQVPPEGEVVTRPATGRFTIRGVTRTVTFDLRARRVAGRIEVLASIPVRWSDYGIPDPGNGFVRVQDNGTIELLLQLDRA